MRRLLARLRGRSVLARHGLWNAASFVLTAVTMFCLSPFLVHRLGDSAYGIWALLLSLTGYMGFADLGIRPAIVHFVARHDALGDHAALNRYVNSAFVTFAAGGALVLGLSAGGAAVLPRLFDLPPGLAGEARLALLVAGCELAIALPLNAYSAVLIGRQRFDLTCRIDIATLALRTALIVGVLLGGFGLAGIAGANALANLLGVGRKARLAFRVQPALRFAPGLADRAAAKALAGFGGFVVLYTLATQLIRETDAFVIGAGLSVASITYFAVAAGLLRYLRSFVWAVTRVVEPAAGAHDARGDAAAIRAMLVATSRTLLFCTVPALVYLLVAGRPFLARWMGERFRDLSGPVLMILTAGALAPLAMRPFVSVLIGTNRVRPLALVAVAEGACNLALSIALLRPLGIAGVALGTAVPATLMHLFVVPRLAGRALAVDWRSLFRQAWLAPLAAGAATWGCLRLAIDPDGTYGWPALFGFGLATVTLFALFSLLATRTVPLPEPEGAA